jgi:hypothetical protein
MVCEAMADTPLYGTISLLTACVATAIVPAFYRVKAESTNHTNTDVEILCSGN